MTFYLYKFCTSLIIVVMQKGYLLFLKCTPRYESKNGGVLKVTHQEKITPKKRSDREREEVKKKNDRKRGTTSKIKSTKGNTGSTWRQIKRTKVRNENGECCSGVTIGYRMEEWTKEMPQFYSNECYISIGICWKENFVSEIKGKLSIKHTRSLNHNLFLHVTSLHSFQLEYSHTAQQ